LDSQLGEHLANQIAPFSSCSHEAFGIENLHRAHKYRDTTFTTVNLPIAHWNGILKGKRHFPVYFDLSLRAMPSRCNLMAFLSTIFQDKNLKSPWFDFAIFSRLVK
jgi:hypothetical protein